ncbi:MAG: ATP-dependent helicase [Candidatus Yanofskybacteria bacterium]|nr:ATP-dependent helicase [Candidatus Yanofskybacteria bacterium]
MLKFNMPQFEQLYSQLNSEQKKAVDAIDGPVMVVAGPGTGKTKILTLRIANILKKTDTQPEAILGISSYHLDLSWFCQQYYPESSRGVPLHNRRQ